MRIAELVLLGVAELGILLPSSTADRAGLIARFVLFNNAAQRAALRALAVPGPGGLLSIFCALMLAAS